MRARRVAPRNLLAARLFVETRTQGANESCDQREEVSDRSHGSGGDAVRHCTSSAIRRAGELVGS
jgi:hypothetical protein